MTYTADLTNYSDYRGASQVPLETERNLLLHKLALLVDSINVDNNDKSTATLQQALIDVCLQIKGEITNENCSSYTELVNIKNRLDSIITLLAVLNGTGGIVELLGIISSSIPDVTEATQLQQVSRLSELQVGLNSLQVVVDSLEDAVGSLSGDISTTAIQTTNLGQIATLLTTTTTTVTSLYTLLNDSLDIGDTNLKLTEINSTLNNIEYVSNSIRASLNTLIGSLNNNKDQIIAAIQAIGTISGGGGGSTTPDLSDSAQNIYDIKQVLNEDIRCLLGQIKSALVCKTTTDLGSPTTGGTSGGLVVSTPKIINLVLTNADTEYLITLPLTCRRFSLKARSGPSDVDDDIRYAYTTGIVATSTPTTEDGFYVLSPQSEESEYSLDLTQNLNIYLASSTAGVAVSLLYWV